jgi:hypothetical protein
LTGRGGGLHGASGAARDATGAPTLVLLGLLAVGISACWRTGEPTPSAGLVTWAAYPDSVRVGATFSFEFAGPISGTACGRLDTALLAVTETEIVIEARRSTFRAVCANQRISFYEARPIALERAGRYAVRTAGGRSLGTLVATDSGAFSAIGTRGEGTVREAGGCWLFGPGWVGNQRVFSLSGAPEGIKEMSETDRIVHVEGRLRGFTTCGSWGSRPRIEVDTAWVTDRRGADWYSTDARR